MFLFCFSAARVEALALVDALYPRRRKTKKKRVGQSVIYKQAIPSGI
jgi:hypothetical protein